MFSKFFIFLSSFFRDDVEPVQPKQVIVVSVPEDEIVIEDIRPVLASMYY